MLIIEVALGIVVAVLVLSYLSEILAVNLILGIIIIGIGLIGIVLMLVFDTFSFISVVAVGTVVVATYAILDYVKLLRLKNTQMPKSSNNQAAELEKKRRRLLGYDA